MIPSAEYSIPSNWALKILYMDPRLETLKVAREPYVKKKKYLCFFDVNMIKFMIWICSIVFFYEKI
jgi:hypothetical protein